MGRMIEEMEGKMRNSLDQVYQYYFMNISDNCHCFGDHEWNIKSHTKNGSDLIIYEIYPMNVLTQGLTN